MSVGSTVFDTTDRMRRRKITKKGFQLCMLVCGRAGLGKSTFVNTLCDGEVFEPLDQKIAQSSGSTAGVASTNALPVTRDLEVRQHKVDLGESDGTVVSLTIVDTPGFGDKIDNSDAPALILEYLEAQFDAVLMEEARVHRNSRFEDNRVHVCLYFLQPTSHGLRELDIELMTTLSPRVNIIPVIAKADTMTDAELLEAKRQIMSDIELHGIPIFTFSCDPEDDDQEAVDETMALREMMPFAVVGSNSIYQIEDEYIRGRNYPWGFVRIEDPMHTDFVALRSVIFGSHIQELRDSTQDIIYEKYRTERLCGEPDLLVRMREHILAESMSLDTTSLSGTLGPMSHATPVTVRSDGYF